MNAPANLPRGRDLRRSSQPRRGLHREEAAVYIGVSATKFDEMVEAGTMPKPKEIGTRRVWDLRALDSAFDALPDVGGDDRQGGPSSWD